MSLLGIDLGSSSVKGVVFDYSGKQLASASCGYTTLRKQNRAEADPDEIWTAVKKTIKSLSEDKSAGDIEALAISSHGETIIPVDREGKAVGNAIMNSDNRAHKELEMMEKIIDKRRLYGITGVPMHTMFSLLKIMWLKENKPDAFGKTAKFLSVGDFIISKLGAGFYTDYSLADRTMCFDINKLEWSDEILLAAGLKKDLFAEAVASGKTCGSISKQAAKELGLKDNVVIAVGGHDQPCGAFGAGAYRNKDAAVSAGTYESLNIITDEPKNNDEAYRYKFNSYPHVVEGKYINLGFFPAGFATSWFIDEFCYEDKVNAQKEGLSVYEYIDSRLDKANFSAHYFLPYLVGSGTPHWDADVSGALLGLSPSTSRYDVFKSIFEGIAFELNWNLRELQNIIGDIKDIRISGGNSRLDFSVQLRADICGRSFTRVNTVETVCLGAAMFAGMAVGVYKDYEDAVSNTVNTGRIFESCEEKNEMYSGKFEQYKKIYGAVKDIK